MSGVHYATPSRSGQTDDNGAFSYLPGEKVTFSIGGVQLGSAPGAATITPFSLAGIAPPLTEVDLRRELDRARRIATPFARAVNIERLLIALDADHDPANGISVAARAASLTLTEIDFGLRPADFAIMLQKRVPDITGNLPVSEPAVFLYRALGLVIPAHVQDHARTTIAQIPGAQPVVSFVTYATSGTRASQGLDFEDDGRAEYENDWRYDSLGRIVAATSKNLLTVGAPPVTQLATSVYDARGDLRGVDEQEDENSDGQPEQRTHRELTSDDHGFTTGETADTDLGADGVVDSHVSTHVTFDSHHNVVATVTERVGERRSIEAHYDAHDRLVSTLILIDHDGDGRADSVERHSNEYAGDGPGVSRAIDEQDAQNDGVVDARSVTTISYDDNGDLLTTSIDFDRNADGVVDGRTRIQFAYDDARREISRVELSDLDGDGRYDELTRFTRSFDALGNLLRLVTEFDVNDDGQVDSATRQTSTYGEDGQTLEITVENRSPGETDYSPGNHTTVSNVELADGIQTLAQQYLDDLPATTAASLVP